MGAKNSKLLIVESPTKARTITRMVGDDFKIMASMGHIRDLPERELGVDVEHDFTPQYVASARSTRTVADLKAAAKQAVEIYLAPDPDREGEAIAWHLKEVLGKEFKGDFKRVSFHEITRSAILKALEHGGAINMELVDAQQARRVLDRLVGYRISPLLWSQVAKGSSAGRVQSVALRLIVEREREITAFQPEEYWVFKLKLISASGVEFEVKLAKIDGRNFTVANADDAARTLTAILHHHGCRIDDIDRTRRFRSAPPPFTTSTLQQAANQQLRFSATATMRVAQSLYEGVELGSRGAVGLITYMRTDSVNIAAEARTACAAFIAERCGKEYLPEKPNFYKSKSGAQEAHEAIRPTDVTRTPEELRDFLDAQQLKLYTLIWKRFVASQMTKAELEQLSVAVGVAGADGKHYEFRAAATAVIFPGYMQILGAGREEDEEAESGTARLERLNAGEDCAIADALKEQKFTEPPPRFTEATLIKELEENGIGRPSTYATILQTIQNRKYTLKEQNKLVPTELGCKVTDFLVQMLPELFDVGFTSQMENELDAVEAGSLKWTAMMREFYDRFERWLAAAKNHGTVGESQLTRLTDAMRDLRFAPPEKSGKYKRDDKKFFLSIVAKLDQNAKVSARQFSALLDLAVTYADQIPELRRIAAESGIAAELDAAFNRAAARKEQLEAAKANGVDTDNLRKVFAAFEAVEWAPAVTRKGRTYDDKVFFESLKQQAESGKLLSERQLAALGKIALRYREALKDYEAVAAALALPGETELAAADAAAGAQNDEAQKLLDQLAGVTAWATPEKKGRRTYDDKEFYESLKQQAASGRRLSDKQLAALRKLAGRYASK